MVIRVRIGVMSVSDTPDPTTTEERPMVHDSSRRPPLTLKVAAVYLNVTERFMRRAVAERRIPFHKVGRLVRFLTDDLDHYLAGGRVEPAPTSRYPW